MKQRWIGHTSISLILRKYCFLHLLMISNFPKKVIAVICGQQCDIYFPVLNT